MSVEGSELLCSMVLQLQVIGKSLSVRRPTGVGRHLSPDVGLLRGRRARTLCNSAGLGARRPRQLPDRLLARGAVALPSVRAFHRLSIC